MIPISSPEIGPREEELVLEVLRSRHLVQGAMVERFERVVAEVVGARHVVAVDNGTSALVAALRAHGIGPGDEVITTAFTFVATLNAILHAGATARIVDIGNDYNLDIGRVMAAIGPSTAAVLPVHLYGLPADMVGLESLAEEKGLLLVEDAAQALGASQQGRGVGSFGTGCFSFYATKNATTGEGGAVSTNDDGVAESLRVFRNQGQRSRYDYAGFGLNLRMSDLHAAVGVAQMERYEGFVSARRANAEALRLGLKGLPGLEVPDEPWDRRHVYHQFTVRVTGDAGMSRDQLSAALADEGIGSGIYYPRPVHDYDCFQDHDLIRADEVPNARRLSQEVLSLPVHPALSGSDLDRIVETVSRLVKG